MIHFERWKIWFIALVCLWGVMFASPNLMSETARESFADKGWAPHKTISLGLDLQGGAHLLFQADMEKVIKERLKDVQSAAKSDLRKENIDYIRESMRVEGHSVVFQIKNMEDRDKAYKLARKLWEGIEVDVSDEGIVTATFGTVVVTKLKTQTLDQSIEIVRKRVDETGTKEPIIQRQGYDRILLQLPGVDDPERIKTLIGKTAVMSFHLIDEKSSIPGARVSPSSKLYPMQEDPAVMQAVKRRKEIQGKSLIDAQPTFQDGQPIVTFRLDKLGGRKFCKITRAHTKKRFAVVLDGEIITAPVINEPICAGTATISGRFTVQETVDLALLLRAGALPTTLTVIEERTVGPSLGADSVEAGKTASIVGMALVLVFMMLVYGLFGIFANIALILNMFLIFAVLSVLQATLTLPGIAGIVLTIGMAVDANVLIFERIREEVRNGRSIISSVDTGYGQAMSTIIDANLTTLIAALLLFSFGTGPIKGFAVTLWVGIMTSMFSAIMLTRFFVVTWLMKRKPESLPI